MTPEEWKKLGVPRPYDRGDGVPTRADIRWLTDAEKAILTVIGSTEGLGASAALTDAVILLGKARDRIADHVEAKTER